MRGPSDAGTIRSQIRALYLANALDNYQIGVEEVDDVIWSMSFGTVPLARFGERDFVIRGYSGTHSPSVTHVPEAFCRLVI